MSEISVNKIDAARRQLETAIELLMDDGDFVSIHTLACASGRILRDLAINRRLTFHKEWLSCIKPEKQKHVQTAMNRAANFFKHADKDPDDVFDQIHDTANDFFLMMACQYYAALGHQWTPRMVCFLCWFNFSYPDCIKDGVVKEFLTVMTPPDWHILTRKQQFEIAKEATKRNYGTQVFCR